MKRLLDVWGRLGGALATPHRTLPALVEQRRGSVFEVLFLAGLAGVIVSPTRVGLAVLLVRASPGEGLVALLDAVFGRFQQALLGVLVAALLLAAVDRGRGGRAGLGFDRALDVCAYALVPYFVLAIVGATAAALGADLPWLPHRLLRGQGLPWLGALTASYALSVFAFGVLLRHAWRVAPPEVSA